MPKAHRLVRGADSVHYPFWYVPGLTAPMWIAVVAVLHVYVAMYAVGGSILLAAQTRLAYRLQDRSYLSYLRSHTWFFLLLTVILGSVLGVGIWWTIGLASPLATEELIHVFVLAWGMEYVTFLVEILSLFVFFYYWGRLDEKTHVRTGWIYAGAAFGSLLIITAITAFQLNIGNWAPRDGMWKAFFNPQAVPQIAARLGGSVLLGALYFFLHSSLKLRTGDPLAEQVGRQSAKWAVAGAVLTIAGGLGWMANLPASGEAALVGAAALNILMTIVFAVTAGVVLIIYVVPLRNPDWLTPGFAILFFGLGLTAIGASEFVREAVRKPYIVYNRVLGNQVRPEKVPSLRRTGYLAGGVWTSAYLRERFPEALTDGKIDVDRLAALPKSKLRQVGATVFMYHCNDCHSLEGYSSVAQLTRGWRRDMVHGMVVHLDRFHFFMPPWSGTDAEAEALTEFLMSVRHPYPEGLLYELGEQE